MVKLVPAPSEEGLTSKLSGVTKIDGFFHTWVKKGAVIGEELSKTFEYYCAVKDLDKGLDTLSLPIHAYDGEGDPDWVWDESGNLSPNIRHVCTLTADLSGLLQNSKAQRTSRGQIFWKVDYNVKIFFGGTALKARLTWYEGVSISCFHPHVTDIWLAPFRKFCAKDLLALFRTQFTRSRLLPIIKGWGA